MSTPADVPTKKDVIRRVTSSGRRSLQYSHGDEGFWDKVWIWTLLGAYVYLLNTEQLNKLQKKYLPALSSLIENIEAVIKEHGTTRQILEIRAKLGQLVRLVYFQ